MSRTTFSILLILVGFGVYYFFFVDQWAALQEVRADASAADAALVQLKDISAKAESLRDVYNSVKQSDKDKITKMIPSGPSTADVVTDFEQMAARNGLILRSVDFGGQLSGQPQPGVQPQNINLKTGVYTLPVNVEVDGRYDALRRFLADLELNQRVLDMSSIDFGTANADTYNFHLRTRAYYQ